jgi:hypothetical protein
VTWMVYKLWAIEVMEFDVALVIISADVFETGLDRSYPLAIGRAGAQRRGEGAFCSRAR